MSGEVLSFPEPIDWEKQWKDLPDELRKLGASLARLDRLKALEAPLIILNNERAIVSRRAREATMFCAGLYHDHRAFDQEE